MIFAIPVAIEHGDPMLHVEPEPEGEE